MYIFPLKVMGIFHCPLYVSSPEGNCFGMNLTPPGEASIWLQPSKWYFFFRVVLLHGTKGQRSKWRPCEANWDERGFPWSGNLLWNILKEHSASWDVKNPVENGKNYQPQLVQDFFHQQWYSAGFLPSTVVFLGGVDVGWEHWINWIF